MPLPDSWQHERTRIFHMGSYFGRFIGRFIHIGCVRFSTFLRHIQCLIFIRFSAFWRQVQCLFVVRFSAFFGFWYLRRMHRKVFMQLPMLVPKTVPLHFDITRIFRYLQVGDDRAL